MQKIMMNKIILISKKTRKKLRLTRYPACREAQQQAAASSSCERGARGAVGIGIRASAGGDDATMAGRRDIDGRKKR
jgi:hypothetical protein